MGAPERNEACKMQEVWLYERDSGAPADISFLNPNRNFLRFAHEYSKHAEADVADKILLSWL
jgi:hypothetical protein